MTWRVSETALAYSVAAALLLGLGVLAGRADVAVLGVPLAGVVLWGWLRRPAGAATVGIARARAAASHGEVAGQLEIAAPDGADTVWVRVEAPGHTALHALVGAEADRAIRVSIESVRTGRYRMFAGGWLGIGANGITRGSPQVIGGTTVTLLPRVRALRELPLPFRLQGLTGGHDSRRAGDGGDLRDVNLFTPGDRLRRIDWRVTARRAGPGSIAAGVGSDGGMRLTELYVRRTFATADAAVMLVLDSRDEVGPDVTAWGDRLPARQDEATSLDLAREAAASLARHYLDQGDRVGMVDLGRSRAPVAPAGGRRHLHRLTQRLVLAQPEGDPFGRVRPPQIPSGALIVLLSTFLDDQSVATAVVWRHSGHRVVAVDVLPVPVPDYLPPGERIAFEILRLEREERLKNLVRSGVELVPWEGSAASRGADDAPVLLTALARSRVRR
jgi:uncharacterized protein (DUF58 family)